MRLAIAIPLLAACLSAQGWVDVTPGSPGPVATLFGSAMSYDPVRGVSWLFGAASSWGIVEIRSWDGAAWTLVPQALPPVGIASQAVWDPGRQETIVFISPTGGSITSVRSWDGTSWTSLSNAPASPTPGQFLVAFDPPRNEMLMVSAPFAGALQTYTSDGVNWTQEAPLVGPSGLLSTASLFYDDTRSRCVLTINSPTAVAPAYWEWSGTNWIQSYPLPRHDNLGQVAPAAAHAASLAQTFYSLAPAIQPRTFVIANGSFSELFLTNWPAQRTANHLVYDSGRDRFVLHGGSNFVDTWELELGPAASYGTFGSGCLGSNGVPTLLPQYGAVPRVGTSFTVQVNHLPWSGPAFMFLGFSDQTWGSTPLPINLAGLGAPQCNLHISGDLLFTMPNVLGVGIWTLGVPNLPGATFFNQAVAFDPVANPLGLTLSNAGSGVIGN